MEPERPITDAEDMLHDIEQIDRANAGKQTKVKAATIRRMLTDHGFRAGWIAEQLDVPIGEVETIAAELRRPMSPEQLFDLLPKPIVELISELSGSDDPGDREEVAEFLRKTALAANAILYRRGKERLVATMPADALAEHLDDDIEQP